MKKPTSFTFTCLNAIFTLFFYFLTFPISAQWLKTEGPPGGLVYDIKFAENTLLACGGSGVWRSADKGLSWEDVPELHDGFYPHLSTHGPHVLVQVIHDSIGRRYYQSDDDGFSWAEVTALHWDSISSDMQIFDSFVYARKHSGSTVRSADFGATWELVYPERFTFLADGDKMYRSKDLAILVSVDGGFTWDTLLGFPKSVRLAFKKGDTLIIKDGFEYGSVSVSGDGGNTWKTIPVNASDFENFDVLLPHQGEIYAFEKIGSRAWMTDTATGGFEPLLLPPQTHTSFGVVSTGDQLLRSAVSNGVLQSTDGTDWAKANGLNACEINHLKICDGNLYAATKSGLYKLLPDKHHWELVAPEYELKEVRDAIVTGNHIVISTWAGQIWVSSDGGGSFQWASETDDSPVWSMERLEKAGEYIFGWGELMSSSNIEAPRYSDDNGFTWESMYPLFAGLNPKNLTFSAGHLYMLTTGGIIFQWNTASEEFVQISTMPVPYAPNNFLVIGNEPFYVKDSVLIVTQTLDATFDYLIFVSTDNGQSWQEYPKIVTTGIYGDRNVRAIEMSGDTIFVALDNNGIFYSADFGASWQPFSEGLWRKSAISLSLFEGEIFAGGDGVYRRKTNGELPTVSTIIPVGELPFNIFPNPFNDHFTVEFANSQTRPNIRIYDMLGRLVTEAGPTTPASSVYLTGFEHKEAGIYMVEVWCDGKRFIKKVFKPE